MKKGVKNAILGFLGLAIIVVGIILLLRINPQEIVAKIGATNGYTIIFLLGAFGGVSLFAGPSYALALTTLSIGGLNAILLGICGGTGLTVGDIILFSIGLSAAKKTPDKFQKKLEKFKKMLEKRPAWMTNLALYLYLGFTPLPNEIVTIPLGMVGMKKKTIIFFLFLANLTSGILIAALAPRGISLFR